MTRVTRQLKYYKLQLMYPENITHNNRRISYTHSHTQIQPSTCKFLCNWEGSTTEMVISEVMEAKYKIDKTIVPHLLRMYFHDCFMQVCECTICPINTQKIVNLVG